MFEAVVSGPKHNGLVAVKTVPIGSDTCRESLGMELLVGMNIKHPNLVTVKGYSGPIHTPFSIFMERCHTDLRTVISQHLIPQQSTCLEIITQLAGGLAAVHQAGCVHRDIKAENVMLNVYEDGSVVAKLGDFGLATGVGHVEGRAGTRVYMPPELQPEKRRVGPAAVAPSHDVFGLGMLAFEMGCTHSVPTALEDEVFDSAANGELVDDMLKRNCVLRPQEKRWLQLVRWMTHPNPNRRPTAQQVVDYLQSRTARDNHGQLHWLAPSFPEAMFVKDAENHEPEEAFVGSSVIAAYQPSEQFFDAIEAPVELTTAAMDTQTHNNKEPLSQLSPTLQSQHAQASVHSIPNRHQWHPQGIAAAAAAVLHTICVKHLFGDDQQPSSWLWSCFELLVNNTGASR